MMEIVAHESCYGVQSTMGGGASWSWWKEPWIGIVVIVMIMFEMMASRWIINQKLLCWDLDTKYNHEMEYDSRMFVSDPLVSLICLNLQCIFRKSLVYYTDAAFLWIKNVKRTSYEKAADLSTIIRQIFMNNYMSMI